MIWSCSILNRHQTVNKFRSTENAETSSRNWFVSGHHLITVIPSSLTEEERVNYEQNISDAFSVISKLQHGIDVNVGFSAVTSVELTPEIVIFDLLGSLEFL